MSGKVPPSLTAKCSLKQPRHSSKLNILIPRIDLFMSILAYSGSVLWNSLPVSIRRPPGTEMFQITLHVIHYALTGWQCMLNLVIVTRLQHYTTLFMSILAYSGSVLWNSLPVSIRRPPGTEMFQITLHVIHYALTGWQCMLNLVIVTRLQHYTTLFMSILAYSGSVLWNSLPVSIRRPPGTEMFQITLHVIHYALTGWQCLLNLVIVTSLQGYTYNTVSPVLRAFTHQIMFATNDFKAPCLQTPMTTWVSSIWVLSVGIQTPMTTWVSSSWVLSVGLQTPRPTWVSFSWVLSVGLQTPRPTWVSFSWVLSVAFKHPDLPGYRSAGCCLSAFKHPDLPGYRSAGCCLSPSNTQTYLGIVQLGVVCGSSNTQTYLGIIHLGVVCGSSNTQTYLGIVQLGVVCGPSNTHTYLGIIHLGVVCGSSNTQTYLGIVQLGVVCRPSNTHTYLGIVHLGGVGLEVYVSLGVGQRESDDELLAKHPVLQGGPCGV